MKKRGIGKIALSVIGSLILSSNIYASSIGVVTADGLNVRSGPSTSSSIVDYVHKGDQLEIIDTQDSWYRIHLATGSDAYVHSKYVTITETDENTSLVSSKEANLFNAPDVMATVIGTLQNGQSVTVLYPVGDWYYVESPEGKGYIHYKTLSATKATGSTMLAKSAAAPEAEKKQYARVATSILNVRQEPSTSAKKIGKVYQGGTYEIIEVLDDWVSIKTADGSTGYLHQDYISISEEAPTITSNSELGTQIVNYAKQFLGNRYVWGGNSLTKGVDCSGFTQQVMKHFGISINRTSSQQIKNGTRVAKGDLKAGDLVFFGWNGRINHVAIYMGNNMIIHANNPQTGIIMNALNDKRMRPYIGATRVIK